MVPAPCPRHGYPHTSRLLFTLLSLLPQYVVRFFRRHVDADAQHATGTLHLMAKRESRFDRHDPKGIVFVVLIPVLVLLSGLFAGLTLGYMSLDETQLNVLSISGTPEQRKSANKIMPIRKNGHLLLVTLLLANMIVNESLPVIADPVLGGGIPSVIVSTALIVIFAEIIPQSLFTRHGLYLGAKMAGLTRILIYALGIIAWPVAKLLEFVLGPHHGIIYRRAELKELIAMHSLTGTHGGDLKTDTVTIIGATLDLQEKVVKQAMTPISDVFMLSIDSKLDYDLLKKICQTGHSRVPVYEEIVVPVTDPDNSSVQRTQKVKKILGILLVKHCVLLDPKDATPLRKIPLNKVPFVPNNEPLLGILDKFQEGRSHMAIVSRFSVEKAASVKKAVKHGLTRRLRKRVGMGDSDSDSSDFDKEPDDSKDKAGDEAAEDGEATLKGDGLWEKDFVQAHASKFVKRRGFRGRGRFRSIRDIEKGIINEKVAESADEKKDNVNGGVDGEDGKKSRRTSFQIPRAAANMASMSMLEQSMPADAVLAKEGAEQFLQNFDPAVNPLGIITLEDVLEELIGEEIYDEFDPQGARGDPYEVPPPVQDVQNSDIFTATATPAVDTPTNSSKITPSMPILMPMALKNLSGLGFLRSRSAPPTPREKTISLQAAHEVAMVEDNGTPADASDVEDVDGDVGRGRDGTLHGFPRTESQTNLHSAVAHGPSAVLPSLRITTPSGLPVLSASMPVTPIEPSRPGSASGAKSKAALSTPPLTAPPPLEAVLLDRKRRIMQGGGSSSNTSSAVGSTASLQVGGNSAIAGRGAVPASGAQAVAASSSGASASASVAGSGGPTVAVAPQTVTVRSSSVKGARFKSSPLGGGDMNGAVVAEKLKQDSTLEKSSEGEEAVEG